MQPNNTPRLGRGRITADPEVAFLVRQGLAHLTGPCVPVVRCEILHVASRSGYIFNSASRRDFGPYLHNKPSCEASVQPVREMDLYPLMTGSAFRSKRAATMASADFCHGIRTPLDALSHQRQHGRSPRVLRTHLHVYACRIYVTVYWPAHPTVPPLSASCSSSQRFAYSFLQIPPRDRHPCCSANTSPCRVCRGLALPSKCALPGAPKEKAGHVGRPVTCSRTS